VLTQVGDGDRLERQGGVGADFEMGVDLSCELSSRLTVGAEARRTSPPVLVVIQIPATAAEIGLDLADSERDGLLAQIILREPSHHNTPQTWRSEDVAE
jgi:hypothetical protein